MNTAPAKIHGRLRPKREVAFPAPASGSTSSEAGAGAFISEWEERLNAQLVLALIANHQALVVVSDARARPATT